VNRRTLDRDFEADRPNQTWLTDFTYIWTAEGWLHVAAVLDLFSRDRHWSRTHGDTGSPSAGR